MDQTRFWLADLARVLSFAGEKGDKRVSKRVTSRLESERELIVVYGRKGWL